MTRKPLKKLLLLIMVCDFLYLWCDCSCHMAPHVYSNINVDLQLVQNRYAVVVSLTVFARMVVVSLTAFARMVVISLTAFVRLVVVSLTAFVHVVVISITAFIHMVIISPIAFVHMVVIPLTPFVHIVVISLTTEATLTFGLFLQCFFFLASLLFFPFLEHFKFITGSCPDPQHCSFAAFAAFASSPIFWTIYKSLLKVSSFLGELEDNFEEGFIANGVEELCLHCRTLWIFECVKVLLCNILSYPSCLL